MAKELQNKWSKNQTAAAYLKDAGLHTSVVHCAYYACVQLMKHIVIYNIGITSEQIETTVRNTTYSTHSFLINEIVKLLRNEAKDWSDFNKKINDLKTMRNDMDYSDDVSADVTKSSNSILLSEAVINMIKQYQ